MKNPRKKFSPTRRSPDTVLREASKTLAVLGGTLLDVRSRLKAAKGWTGMIGRRAWHTQSTNSRSYPTS